MTKNFFSTEHRLLELVAQRVVACSEDVRIAAPLRENLKGTVGQFQRVMQDPDSVPENGATWASTTLFAKNALLQVYRALASINLDAEDYESDLEELHWAAGALVALGVPVTDRSRAYGAENALTRGMRSGFWKSCSGCYETNEGHPPPGAKLFSGMHCHLGSGCSECLWLGAVWDTTDYDAFSKAMLQGTSDTSEVARLRREVFALTSEVQNKADYAAEQYRAAREHEACAQQALQQLDFVLQHRAFLLTSTNDAGRTCYQLVTQNTDEEYVSLSDPSRFFSDPREAVGDAVARGAPCE